MVVALALVLVQTDLDRHVYPMAKPIAAPKVTIDCSDFPEGEPWMKRAQSLVQQYFPIITTWLATEDFKSPAEIKLIVKKEISAPAWATGDSITVSGKWITQHPEDLGMMIHELTHVVQQYPNSRNKPGWLVEGIADYIRWWRYEPELHATKGRTKVDASKANYTDSYRTTAVWLAWVSRTYDMRLVPQLDRAMRMREDPMEVFPRLTKKKADELWKEFTSTL